MRALSSHNRPLFLFFLLQKQVIPFFISNAKFFHSFCKATKVVEAEMHKLEKVLDMIKFKCWYYDQAIADGAENRVLSMIPDGLPDEIRAAYENAHIG